MTLASATTVEGKLHVFWPVDVQFSAGDIILGWRQEVAVVVAGSKSSVNVKWFIIPLLLFADELA